MKIKTYLNQSPIFALNAVYESTIPKINKLLKRNNLNLLQGFVLTALFFEDNIEITPSDLAEVFQTTRGNMSHILSALEYHGLIKRVVQENDARKFHIILKADGKKTALKLIHFFDKIQSHFENELGSSSCKKTVDGIFNLGKTFKQFSNLDS